MNSKFLSFVICLTLAAAAYARDGRDALKARTADRPSCLLPVLDVCGGVSGHVQGVAADLEKGYLYFSFTTRFVKTDLQGRVIGSIDRIQGHLGAMTLGPDGKVYASLECKDDVIGRGIARSLGVDIVAESRFYVAVIDVDRVDHVGIDPENDTVLRTACLGDPCRDYAWCSDGLKHRYGCSGIDGITFAPVPGHDGKMLLYVAYGIYGEASRTDNDYQVLLCYDPERIDRRAQTVTFGTLHGIGPGKPVRKYFVHTGNTSFGVQNLAYDPFTGTLLMAVYKGRKADFPNFTLFAADMEERSFKARLSGVTYEKGKVRQLDLAPLGLLDDETGVRGWYFKWGATGLFPLGGGYYLVSENHKDPLSGVEYCRLHLMQWTGDPEHPFIGVPELSIASAV